MKQYPPGYSHRGALIERYKAKIKKATDKLEEYLRDTKPKSTLVAEFHDMKIQDLKDNISELRQMILTVHDGTHPLIQELEYHNPVPVGYTVPASAPITRPVQKLAPKVEQKVQGSQQPTRLRSFAEIMAANRRSINGN